MRLILSLVLLLSFCSSFAQSGVGNELYMPLEIQKAYKAGTRSMNGEPGPNYWQNHAEYDIDVEIIPAEKYLKGKALITYSNNSPDPLNYICFTLLYEILREGTVRDDRVPSGEVGSGMTINEIQVAGKVLDLKSRQVTRAGTNLYLRLEEPIAPNSKTELVFDWEFPLYSDLGRSGYVDSTTCFVGYWYPKISVYDDIEGWDTNPFRGTAEFYSDLSDLEVSITIPDNYTVWSTGVLQNAAEVLPDPLLERFENAKQSNEVIAIIGETDREAGVTMKSTTWTFKADQVPDFAFAFSDHYLWDAIGLAVDTRPVRLHNIYPASRKEYCSPISKQQQDIMRFFSEDMPGIPFPYPEFTTFFKPYPGGGMEFPMMANNGSSRRENSMISVVAHEMYHMYVPFYIRINEEKYAWMDEGWADFMDTKALAFIKEQPPVSLQGKVSQKLFFERALGSSDNVPLITSTQYTGDGNYGFLAYSHPSFLYSLLYDILGEEQFKTCYQGYMKRWAYKAPTPYDFFNSFNDLSGQNLNWFWKSWFMEYGYPDLAIKEFKKGKATVQLKGVKPLPIELVAVYEDGEEITQKAPITVWKDGKREVEIDFKDKRKPLRVHLNPYSPDIDKSNNFLLLDKKFENIDLADYTGRFSLPNNGVATITAGDQHFIYESSNSGNRYLFLPIGKDQFGTIDRSFTLTFERDDSGKVVKYKSVRFDYESENERMD